MLEKAKTINLIFFFKGKKKSMNKKASKNLLLPKLKFKKETMKAPHDLGLTKITYKA